MCAKRKISGGRTWTFLCIAILRVARARARAGGVPLTRRRRRRRSARVRARGWTNTLRDEEFSAAMCARDESGTVRSRVQSGVGSARSEDTEGTEKKVVFSVPSVLALSAPCWDECALGSKAVWREAGRRRGRARRAGLARALTAGAGGMPSAYMPMSLRAPFRLWTSMRCLRISSKKARRFFLAARAARVMLPWLWMSTVSR